MTKDDGEQKVVKPNALLRAAREQKSLSHQELAQAIGLPDPHTLGRWERGLNVPHHHYRRKLSDVLGKSMEELGLVPGNQKDEQETLPSEPVDAPISPERATYTYSIKPSFTSFIGREAAIARVCELLRSSDRRLVTILGPGGVGKTRLAGEVAEASREQFGGGICMVSLTTIDEPALVLPALARELHIRENDAQTLPEAVRWYFQSRRAFLLILDNFEHILAAGSLVEQLLADCPTLKVLVTSRSVLHLAGEQEFTLDPLPVPRAGATVDEFLHCHAVQLFVRRAQARVDTFQATAENLPLIGQICAALDGLPLAIELAAARVKLFPLPVLLEEISEHRLQLHLPRSTGAAQTLGDTIKWSYDLLNEQEQWLFRHLAVFPGGGTLAAVKTIWESSPLPGNDVLSLLMSLLDKSMLRSLPVHEQAQPLFSMLETIRVYGITVLEQRGELEAARQIHARYYLKLLITAREMLKGPQQGAWLAILEQERANLSAVLAWLIERRESEQALTFCDVFGKFCGLRGYWSEEAHWLAAVLELSRTEPATRQRGRVLRRAAHLAYRQRTLATARALFEESIAISQELDDQSTLAGALSGLAWVLYRGHEPANVLQLLEQSVEVARRSGDAWSLANVLESLGRFTFLQGQPTEASSLLQEGIDLARKLGDGESLVRLLLTTASVEKALGDTTRAAAYVQEGFRRATELGNKPLIALTLASLADVAIEQKDRKRAAELYEQRMQLAHELSDEPAIASARLKLSELALQEGDAERAASLAQESLAFFQMHEDRPNIALASSILQEIAQRA